MTYDDMPAGPEMDLLVLVRVLGADPPSRATRSLVRTGVLRIHMDGRHWSPSTNDSDAQDLADGLGLSVATDTSPLAICRAALKAVT